MVIEEISDFTTKSNRKTNSFRKGNTMIIDPRRGREKNSLSKEIVEESFPNIGEEGNVQTHEVKIIKLLKCNEIVT